MLKLKPKQPLLKDTNCLGAWLRAAVDGADLKQSLEASVAIGTLDCACASCLDAWGWRAPEAPVQAAVLMQVLLCSLAGPVLDRLLLLSRSLSKGPPPERQTSWLLAGGHFFVDIFFWLV